MRRMCFLPAAGVACAVLVAGSITRADLLPGSSGNGYSNQAVPAAGWVGTPVYQSLASANLATTPQGAPSASDTNGDSVATPMLSEIFTPTTTFNLSSIEIVAGGGNASNNQMNMRLYTLSSSGGTGFPTGNAGASGDNFYFPGTELLGTSGAGLFFNFPGFSGQQLMTFDLNNGANSNDNVTLTAGTTYALEFWQPGSPPANLFIWSRDGAPTATTGGQMMGSKDQSDFSHSRTSIAALGGAPGPRVGALALIAVPEPASISLIGIAFIGFAARRRRV